MQEAAGTKPLARRGTTSEQAEDDFIRTVARETLAVRKEYDRNVSILQPDLDALYTAGSFAERNKMKRSADAAKRLLQLDEETSRWLQKFPGRVREITRDLPLSEDHKAQMLRGFDNAYGSSDLLKVRGLAMTVERMWVAATVDLYEYAVAHSDHIFVEGDKLSIDDEKIRLEFNRKLSRARDLQAKSDQTAEQLRMLQVENMKKYGLSEAQLGIQ